MHARQREREIERERERERERKRERERGRERERTSARERYSGRERKGAKTGEREREGNRVKREIEIQRDGEGERGRDGDSGLRLGFSFSKWAADCSECMYIQRIIKTNQTLTLRNKTRITVTKEETVSDVEIYSKKLQEFPSDATHKTGKSKTKYRVKPTVEVSLYGRL